MAVEVPGSADIFVEITNAATEINVTLTDESPVINVTVEGSGPAGRDGTDGIGVPSGGTTGQVLKKASGEDYDTEWADESGGGGEEEIFWAAYDSSTYSEVEDALVAGKTVIAYKGSRNYPIVDYDEDYVFACAENDKIHTLTLTSSDVWSYSDISMATAVRGLPSGGDSSEILVKQSGSDYDVAWEMIPIGSQAITGTKSGSTITVSDINPAGLRTVLGPLFLDVGTSRYLLVYANGNAVTGPFDFVFSAVVDDDTIATVEFTGIAKSATSMSGTLTETTVGGSSVSPYTSTPAPLGTASPGSSADYARGDHVHPKPTAADVGAIAAPSSPATGAFLVWDGSAWTAQTLSTWQGGSY